MGPDTSWRLVPRLLLRRAGFGVDALEALGDPAAALAADRYRRAVAALEQAREALLRGAMAPTVDAARRTGDRVLLRALSGVRSAAGRRRDLPHSVEVLLAAQGRGAGPDLLAELAAEVTGYRTALAACQEHERALACAVREEQADRARRVRKEITPRMLDAVLQLAPSFHDGLLRWAAACDGVGDDAPAGADAAAGGKGVGPVAGSARERAVLRRIYLYQQRLAAKNESTSFFGPLVHGVVDRSVDGLHLGPVTREGVLTTQPFMAFWAVVALARAMARDPRVRPHVPIGWVPVNRLQIDRVTLADGRVVQLSEQQAVLAATIDGRRSSADLARSTGLPAADVERMLDRLERLGVVRTWPEPPSAVSQPFDVLLADARRWAADTGWPERLSTLRGLMEAFALAADSGQRAVALAALEEEFTELAGVPARRSGGQVYADRMVTFLECHGDQGPLRLGRDVAALIERELQPVLDVGARYGALVQKAHQDRAVRVMRELGVTRMAYDEFVRRMQASLAKDPQDRPDPGAQLVARLTDLVRDRLSGQVSQLTAADLAALAGPTALAGPAEGPRFASPDVLFRQVTPDGPLELVLGEVHPYVFAWGSQRHFCPDPEALDADFAAELACWGGRQAMATVVPRRRHKGLIAEAFPGRFIEVSGLATRERDRVVAITDLTVHLLEGGERVVLRDQQADVVLYAGQDDHPHLLAFAPPATPALPLIRFGNVAPRIVVGSLVAQRAGWWVAPADLLGESAARGLDGDVQGFCSVQRLRVRLGLPRWVFTHLPGEPKPVCIDLDCPLAVDTLLAAVRERPETPVQLREMLPTPDELWLRRHGRAFTSELRLALVGGAR
ncbi:MAG TPA: hypothetical protein VI248_14155 [Kineosporiaceae bacterium]